MNNLSTLGLGPFFEKQLTSEHSHIARVAEEHRGGYQVLTSRDGEIVKGAVKLSGKLTRNLADHELPGVGDWVVLGSAPTTDRTALIESVLDRRTVFIRGAAGRNSQGQVVAANIDVVFIVCGLDDDFNLHRIERYLARVYASGADPVVVLSKSDLCDDPAHRVAQVDSSCIGVEIILSCAAEAQGLDLISSHISHGVTGAFVGSSGAGKSTLINALAGEEIMATREVCTRDGRGRHTTTHRQLIVLPKGGMLVDTPGMRELQLFDEEGIDAVFSDIEKIGTRCRFRDCTHLTEPGCAVKKAVSAGLLSSDRLEHYQRMQKEAQAYELRHNEHERRKSEKVWGQLYEEAKRIRKWKRGI